jgi:heme-degrading monooxygenase HmoA
MEAVRNWARHPIHIEAKEKGRSSWYRYYHSAICEVQSLHVHGLSAQ